MADDKDGITVSNPLPHIKAFADTKAGKITITTILILIPLIIGFLIRAQPLTGENLDRIAQANVDRQLTQQFAQQVQLNNSNLGQSQIRQQAQRQVQSYKTQNPDQYQQRVDQVRSQVADQFSKPDGEPYLIAIDPYYYWRQAQNIQDHGYGADTIRNGQTWNTKQLAPLGSSLSTHPHPQLAVWIHNGLSIFGDFSLYLIFYTLPAVIASLAAIPAYFLGRNVGGRLGGFMAAMLTATHQLFVSRSVAGFSDTDSYVITLPLFAFWFAIETYQSTSQRKQWTWGALTVATMLAFSQFWQGWWLTLIFLIVTSAAVIIHRIGQKLYESWENDEVYQVWTDDVKQATYLGAGLSLGTLAISRLTGGLGPVGIVENVIDRLAINQATSSSLWPNVFTTVAELGQANLGSIISSLGSNTLFYAALASTLIFFLPKNIETTLQKQVYYSWIAASLTLFAFPLVVQLGLLTSLIIYTLPILSGYVISMCEVKETISVAFPVFLTSWLIALTYATTQGTRFNMILLPAYAIALGTGFGWAFKHLRRLAKEQESDDYTYLYSVLASLVLILAVAGSYNVAYGLDTGQTSGEQAGQRLPSMNDAWYNSLEGIQNQSSEDAIITSWWDFGHWFKQVADRPVTFDGGSQNTPNAHWVGRALQTSDEDESRSILRMLHCGNFDGYDELLEYKHDVSTDNGSPEAYLDTKQTLDEALTRTRRENAEQFYQDQGLTEDEATTVANHTHCSPPENYFITSDDMVGKGSVWGHFGLWNFSKAYASQTYDDTNPQETIDRYAENIGISQQKARDLYLEIPELNSQRETNQWIAAYPQYTGQPRSCTTRNTTITCDVNINIGQSRQGQARLEEIIAPRDDKQDTRLIVGIYNQQTGFRQGQQELTPSEISIGEDESITTYNASGDTRLGVFLHESSEGQWQALLASPQLTTSMFTRLYFFDGAYTDNFELVSDKRSPVSGNRIKVWQPQLPGQ